MQRFEYRVVQLRESLVGGKLSADKLEEILNDEARNGWMVKAITSAEVKGRVGAPAVWTASWSPSSGWWPDRHPVLAGLGPHRRAVDGGSDRPRG
jgi:hypothetical protein